MSDAESRSGEPVRLRLRIRGRVQGVCFRYFTLRTAQRLGIAGYVRNEPDGSVLCEAQGEAAKVAALVAEVRHGPEFARVDDVVSESLKPDPAAAPDG